MPKLTLIVPVYNTPIDLFYPAIKSFAEQKIDIDYEILIVDDGSNKETKEAIQRVKHQYPLIQVIEHDKNLGPSSARNTGIKNSNLRDNDYLAIFDSDDLLDAGALQKIIDVFKDNPDADMISYGYRVKYPNKIDTITLTDKITIATPKEFAINYLTGYTWNKVYKKKPNFEFPLCIESMRQMEDKIWNIDILDQSEKIIVIPNVLYTYNVYGGSLSNNNTKAAIIQHERYVGLEKVIKKIKHFGKDATRKQVELYLSHALRDYCYWKYDFKGDKKTKKEQTIKRVQLTKKLLLVIPRKEIKSSYVRNNLYFLFILFHPFTKKANNKVNTYMEKEIEFAENIFNR